MPARPADLVCFSHLRWDFVLQRPHHLLTRAARTMRVLYWEEPVWIETGTPRLDIVPTAQGVHVMQPVVPWHHDPDAVQRMLFDAMAREYGLADPVLWYYTPGALEWSDHLARRLTVYDCMDELSAFAGADPDMPAREQALLRRADVVFTGGRSLFEAKRRLHPNVHVMPSGVDTAHFAPARGGLPEPADQRAIPHPRIGFYGVLDERLDRALLADVADLRPDTHFVLIGPLAKLDAAQLPVRPNLHYLGAREYADLPAYVAHWDAALLPFAMNEATRFISPTKTPEYLAAGCPVVSTPIADVVRDYGGLAGVQVAGTAAVFAAATDRALALPPSAWRPAADAMLADLSWDGIWARMAAHLVPEPVAVAAE